MFVVFSICELKVYLLQTFNAITLIHQVCLGSFSVVRPQNTSDFSQVYRTASHGCGYINISSGLPQPIYKQLQKSSIVRVVCQQLLASGFEGFRRFILYTCSSKNLALEISRNEVFRQILMSCNHGSQYSIINTMYLYFMDAITQSCSST